MANPFAGSVVHGGCMPCGGLIVLPDGDRGRCTGCNRPYGLTVVTVNPRDREGRQLPPFEMPRLDDLSPVVETPGPNVFARLGASLGRAWGALARPRPQLDTPATARTRECRTPTPQTT